jgi:hypothetical protein
MDFKEQPMKNVFSTDAPAVLDLSTPRDPGTPGERGNTKFETAKPAVPEGKRWNAKLGRLEDQDAPNPARPFQKEASAIAYAAGLTPYALLFIERVLALEARLAHFESLFPAAMIRDLEALAGKELPARETAAFAAPRGR